MIDSKTSKEATVLHQIAALIVSLVVFFIILILVGYLLMFLDNFRGPGSKWLNPVFRDIISSWIGGYAGISAATKWLKRSTLKFVFFGFSIVILLLAGAYIGLMTYHPNVTFWSSLWDAFGLAFSIVGAYIAARSKGLSF